MLFLVPRLTLFLLVVFVALLGWRWWRRRHFVRRKPALVRAAGSLGRSRSRRRRKFAPKPPAELPLAERSPAQRPLAERPPAPARLRD